MIDQKDLCRALWEDAAAKIVVDMPREQRTELLNGAVVKALEKGLNSYELEQKVQGCIRVPLLEYVEEYLGDPEVQARLKMEAHRVVETLFDATLRSMKEDLCSNMKSKYERFEVK